MPALQLSASPISPREPSVPEDSTPTVRALFPAVAAPRGPVPASPTSRILDAGFWTRDVQCHLDIPYLVKGLFDRDQLVVLWGAPGSGKTFAALSLSAHIGAGVSWCGRKVKRGRVIYVCAESSRKHLENRLYALTLRVPEIAEAEVLWCPINADLLHGEQDIQDVLYAAQQLGDVALIVIDTLAVTFGGGNENAPEDMNQYVSNLKRIKRETSSAVVVVHHSGKDEAKGMRGHSALLGALDGELQVERPDSGGTRVLKAGKLREGDSFSDICTFELEVKVLGTDADGDPVTTCWMKPSTGPVIRRPSTKTQAGLLRVIEGRHAAGERVWTEREVREAALAQGTMHRNSLRPALIGLVQAGFLANQSGVYALTNAPEPGR